MKLSPSFVFLVVCLNRVTATQVVIDHNGYSNIVVAISPDVPNTYAAAIIQNIQFMIRRASAVLYRATEKRAYFKDVRILVPESWNNVPSVAHTWEAYNTADVKVAPPSSSYGDTPYTLQSGGCGQPGEHIHLTPNYVLTLQEAGNIAAFGPSEKAFVHEWAHLRYGVFDEYGQAGSKSYPLFYRPQGTRFTITPNLCTDKPPLFTTRDKVTQGNCKVDSTTGIYDQNCVYDLLPQFQPQSSFMANHSISSVVDFCKDDQTLTHVYDAPNKQNALCGSRSVWSVIASHPDFAHGNPPIEIGNSVLDPKFIVVRSSGSRFVLVADVSGSMTDHNRIKRLYESSRRWIKYDLSDGSQLGMVQFSTTASVLSSMVVVNSDAARASLISKLPQKAEGWTCIGCGLLKALEVLRPGGLGGIIILLTDGEETHRPFINETLPALMEAGVRVVSIAFGRTAEAKIEDLAMKTNGKSFFVDDDDTSQGLNDAYIGSMTYQPAVPASQITVLLFQKQYQNVSGQLIADKFTVDTSVGRNLIFRADYTQRAYIQSFSLTSPGGIVYNQLVFDDVTKVALFKLDYAQVGEWSFSMRVTNSIYDAVAVTVTTQSRSNSTLPITTECYVPDGTSVGSANKDPVRLLAKVMQGMNPVVGARVRAFIEVPRGPAEELELFDNGAFADTTKDDGIYSRYFIATTSSGRYTVTCQVWSDSTTRVLESGEFASSVLASGARSLPKTDIQSTGSFTRVAQGGSFRVEQPVSVVDPYPPSKITDLFLVASSTANKSITIQFTAPGDDLDSGTVAYYEVRYSTIFDHLRDGNFGLLNSSRVAESDVTAGSLRPTAAGTEQWATFRLAGQEGETYFVALRAVDAAGNLGKPSNVVLVTMAETPVSKSGLSTKAVVGIVIGSILAVLLIAGVAFCIAKKKYISYGRPGKVKQDSAS